MLEGSYPVDIYLLKVNERNIITRYEICLKFLTIKKPEQYNWRHSGVFIVNFQHISHLVLVLLLLKLNIFVTVISINIFMGILFN